MSANVIYSALDLYEVFLVQEINNDHEKIRRDYITRMLEAGGRAPPPDFKTLQHPFIHLSHSKIIDINDSLTSKK
jgi:hypothetical protein